MTDIDIQPKCCIEKQFEKTKVSSIIVDVEEGNYSLQVCEKACRALATVSAIAIQTRNAEILIDFLDEGICELLVLVLQKYGLVSISICSYSCQAIINMCYSSRELKEFLGELGACELVVFITGLHIGDPDVSEYGVCAMIQLAYNNHLNCQKLVDAQAYECLAQVGNFGFNIMHERSCIIACDVCICFTMICEAANATALLECGSDDLILGLLKCHQNNKSFIPYGMRALCSLASLNYDHREALGRIGACQIIFDILANDSRPGVTQDGIEAIMHLSVNTSNSRRLKDVNACPLILKYLNERLMSFDIGVEVCTGAILNLISKGPAMHDHFDQLQKSNIVAILKLAERSPKSSFKARENIFNVIETIGHHRSPSGSSTEVLPVRLSFQSTPQIDLSKNAANLTGREVESLPPNVRNYVEFRRLTSSNGEDFKDPDDSVKNKLRHDTLPPIKTNSRANSFVH